MQWPDKKDDAPIKPYNPRRCKLTASNSAIDVEHQVKLYAEWAKKKGLKKIHVFPPGRTGSNSRKAYDKLLRQDLAPDTKLVEVDPEDWK